MAGSRRPGASRAPGRGHARWATFIILAAHPDDEALGAPGLLARLRRSAHRVVVQLFTAGEQSHPGSPTHSTKELR
ncbi:PIG-L deacetylase family protein [Brevibacterium pigmentatum]|uniref:PIG-L deacetylase family protein n=1 Tax=Brevibacterium pigmentatum TaxID=1496080 RepID=UPI00141E415A